MKLYSEEFVHGWVKCKLVASFCDVPLECPKFEAGKDDKKDDFKKASPLGIYPYLECNDGYIFSSNSICRYVGSLHVDKCIYGETVVDRCKIDGYIDMNTLLLEIPLQAYETRIKIDGKIDGEIDKKIVKDIDIYLSNLDTYLYTHTYICNNRLSLADISIASTLYFYLSSSCSSLSSSPSSIFHQKHTLPSFLQKYINLNRWYSTIINHPKWIKTWKELAPSYAKKMGIEIKTTPKKEKAAAAPATESATGEEEEKPKKKENELDLLPPSKLDLNEWKREYSNNKDLYGAVMKWFWEHYDEEGYSIYLMKYDKMEGECTVGFITANQVGGFLQRLDPNFRKYSFGVIDVLGKEGDFDISGVWLFRGKDIPFMMKDHVSYEYHTFTKLDPKKPQDKQLIADYWCACDTLQGKPISDSKVWK